MTDSYLNRLPEIKAMVFDIDGVFTDGTVTVTNDGKLTRTLYARDGYAIQLATNKGFIIGVITGGRSESVKERLLDLGIQEVYLGARDKWQIMQEFLNKYNVSASQTLYMGDDLPDLEVMNNVSIATCPNDAAYEILEIAHYISHRNGGKGCVRDIVEKVLRAQNQWMVSESDYKW
ncbi:MAG TPA: 3-deoxy-D-manno-octulosonate 8-phosphate phosphatase [Flavobacteriales bacterium]|jgi:3-deoxy-D-manno-octulosonate 8-phosphate phosphatase (KDO 8-P phosphatase)|nr:3-deoxy-D-manno-octulosonate 8-phosphate phosphatase [Flavobacteriales bacterium]